MFAAVVYGVLYIYQLFTNIEVYSCNVLYHTRYQNISLFLSFTKKNVRNFTPYAQFCLIFSLEVKSACYSLPNQPIKVFEKRYLLVWYLLILMTLHMPMFVEPCYLLRCISIHPLVVQSGLVWSSISSTTLLPFPAQCIWHLTILYSWGLYLISSRRKPGCQSCNHVTQPAAKVR